VLRGAGFHNQFEGGWVLNPERLVGRVVTAVFMPRRPDVDSVIRANGKKERRIGEENSWVIDILQPGDVLVVDLFGKIRYGTFAGDNLSTAIFTKSHNGLIVNGAVRDVTGIQQIPGFQVYVRGVDPSALENVMLTGINVPIRIGDTTIMPGASRSAIRGHHLYSIQLARKWRRHRLDRLVDQGLMLRRQPPDKLTRDGPGDRPVQSSGWPERSARRMPETDVATLAFASSIIGSGGRALTRNARERFYSADRRRSCLLRAAA
jgi:hypothetical protein